jgi:hypothetical protein
MINPASRPGGRQYPHRNGGHNCQSEPDQGEFQGGRQPCEQFFQYGQTGVQRQAHIALRQVRAIDEELLEPAAVQPQRLPRLGNAPEKLSKAA